LNSGLVIEKKACEFYKSSQCLWLHLSSHHIMLQCEVMQGKKNLKMKRGVTNITQLET
jgi:hypothetical protein